MHWAKVSESTCLLTKCFLDFSGTKVAEKVQGLMCFKFLWISTAYYCNLRWPIGITSVKQDCLTSLEKVVRRLKSCFSFNLLMFFLSFSNVLFTLIWLSGIYRYECYVQCPKIKSTDLLGAGIINSCIRVKVNFTNKCE